MAIQLHRRPLPALFDWFDEFPFGLQTGPAEHAIRVEEYQEGDTYTVKAELPGIDPDRDVEISVEHGMLTIRAQRVEETREGKRSEFLYGSFNRSLQLPEGVDEDDITARYDNGVLTVTAPAGRVEAHPKRIRVTRGQEAAGPVQPATEPGAAARAPVTGMQGVSDPQEAGRGVMDPPAAPDPQDPPAGPPL